MFRCRNGIDSQLRKLAENRVMLLAGVRIFRCVLVRQLKQPD